MAAKRPLKVFRTSIGFADAYIAVPSQKAALAAWGADGNLFAQGMAELVTDPKLAEAALASPGVVLRVSRGTTADYLAAGKASDAGYETTGRSGRVRRDDAPAKPKPKPKPQPKPQPKPKPRPSRQKLDDARAALERGREQHDRRRARIDAQIEQLRAERARLKGEGDAEVASLQDTVERQEAAYRQALRRWEG